MHNHFSLLCAVLQKTLENDLQCMSGQDKRMVILINEVSLYPKYARTCTYCNMCGVMLWARKQRR